jgi:hypothetical protein
MESLRTVQDDVSAVQEFMSRVRILCARLMANPFNTAAAEALLDLLLDDAPIADLALERVLQTLIYQPVPNGTDILGALGGHSTTLNNVQFVSAAA